ncbi:MAG: methyl-accepting chemotaxis protein [Hahellaceae bacterium]|nr:methyl-accepting chemotaxis protein [Hahellaceae bacterium]MCP5169365.1 methyl-accepting chemotaxis protein [Hahellaceae bacterium]
MLAFLLNIRLKYKFWLVNGVALSLLLLLILDALHTEVVTEKLLTRQHALHATQQLQTILQGQDAIAQVNALNKLEHAVWLDSQGKLSHPERIAFLGNRPENAFASASTKVQQLESTPASLFDSTDIRIVSMVKFDQSGLTLALIHETPSFAGLMLQQSGHYALVVSLLMSLLLAASQLLISFIERHINKLKDVMLHVQQNKDLTATVPISSKDEVGEMAQAFNLMQSGRRETMQAIRNVAQQLNAAAHALEQTGETTEAGMNRQRLQTDQLASATIQMRAAAEEIAQRAVETHQCSETAAQRTGQGAALVSQTQSAIVKLSGAISSAADMVSGLNNDSQRIEKATDEIRAIAEQTNLLALNAAIEAARAGESGRGFAVVADEVRNLAIHAQKATDQIQSVVTQIRESTAKINQTMRDSSEQASQCVSTSGTAADAIQEVSKMVDLVTEKNMMVSAASEEQSRTSEEIENNIRLIRDDTNQTYDNTQAIARYSHTLNEQSEGLFELVKKMKID